MLSQYDLISSGRWSSAEVYSWARGEAVAGLPRLSRSDVAMLLDSWEWNARPGQLWTPGAEFVTSHETGRE